MVHRVRHQWVTRYRLFINCTVGTLAFAWACPEYLTWYRYYFHEFHWGDVTVDEWKKQEKWRWKMYLKMWDPYHTGNMLDYNQGTLSNTRIDQAVYGKYRQEEPMSYEKAANDLIDYAEKTGIDPAKPLLNTIKKMIKYYYPFDLDENPDETKRLLKPKVQFVYASNFDEYVEQEENMPPPGSLGRMCWSIPGMQDVYLDAYRRYTQEEEEILMNADPQERAEYYQNLELTVNRLGCEVDTYSPLLAYRWDRKQKFVHYLQNNTELCNDLLSRPGGLKQIFINAGIITPRDAHDMEQQRTFQYSGGR